VTTQEALGLYSAISVALGLLWAVSWRFSAASQQLIEHDGRVKNHNDRIVALELWRASTDANIGSISREQTRCREEHCLDFDPEQTADRLEHAVIDAIERATPFHEVDLADKVRAEAARRERLRADPRRDPTDRPPRTR
jgi:hypothetical protein